MKLPLKPIRLLLSAMIGALYSCFVFIGDFGTLSSAGIKICFGLLMVYAAFGKCRLRQLVKRALAFFGVTVLMGIFILAMLYFSNIGIRLGGTVKNGVFYFDIPMGLVFVSCIISYVLIFILEKLLKNATRRSFVRIRLTHLDKTVELKALIDTGNMLKDPYSGKKVLIAELGVLSPLFDFDTKRAFETFDSLPQGFRLIPYSSIGNKCGLIAAFIPDSIEIEKEEKNDIITAVFNGTLSQGGDYNALIGP